MSTMDKRTMTVWVIGILVAGTAVSVLALASYQRTRAQADATVARAQEHTKRAEGRHELMDVLGVLSRGRNHGVLEDANGNPGAPRP